VVRPVHRPGDQLALGVLLAVVPLLVDVEPEEELEEEPEPASLAVLDPRESVR
jgi:hypothetical protein